MCSFNGCPLRLSLFPRLEFFCYYQSVLRKRTFVGFYVDREYYCVQNIMYAEFYCAILALQENYIALFRCAHEKIKSKRIAKVY